MADINSQLPVRDIADGSVTPGTAATESLLTGAVYNSTAPSLTPGQQAALQSDANGNLRIDLVGLPNFQTSQYTVGTLAVQITSTPLALRSCISLKALINTTTDIIYIGNSSSVTTSTGYPLFNEDSISFDITSSTTIWAIATSAGQTLCVMEVGGL
jgi:hypothetical protein